MESKEAKSLMEIVIEDLSGDVSNLAMNHLSMDANTLEDVAESIHNSVVTLNTAIHLERRGQV